MIFLKFTLTKQLHLENYFLSAVGAFSSVLTPSLAPSAAGAPSVLVAISNAWPRGPYKALIRLYVNPGSTLTSITSNGQALDSKAYQITVEQNRTVYGIYVEVPIQQHLDLLVTYTESLPTDQAFSYTLFNQFQSGLTPPPFVVTVQTPTYRPVLIAPQAQVTNGKIVFTPPTTLDSLLGVKYE